MKPDDPYPIRVLKKGQFFCLQLTRQLHKAVAWWADQDDYCGLCCCHPSSGHDDGCMLVVEALVQAGKLEPLDEDA